MKKLARNSGLALAALATFGLTACSSSKKADSDASLDQATQEIAQTDPVPADAAELATPAEDEANKDVNKVAQAGDKAATDLEKLAEAPTQAMPTQAMKKAVTTESNSEAEESTPSTTGKFTDYTVQSTDTLMKIAFQTYGDVYQWKKIYSDNKDKIKDPNAVPAGTVLKIDGPSQAVAIDRHGDKYEIQQGDTLGKISDSLYGTPKKWRKIWSNNKQLIKNPNRIFAGFTLYYTMTPEERREAEELKKTTVTPSPLAGAKAASNGRSPASSAPAVAVPSGPMPMGPPPAISSP